VLYAEWEPEQQYRFEADSAAFTNVFHNVSKSMKNEFKVRSLEEYGSIFIHTLLPDPGVVVQPMNHSDKVTAELRADSDGRADFYYLRPADYFVRCFIDRNGNDKWDTGNYAQGVQPEEVFYFPKPIKLKAQWDMEQEWDVRGIPLHQQKPGKLIKQKADKEKSVKNKNKERAAEMERQRKKRSSASSE